MGGTVCSRLDRPALDRLRDQARMGEFDAVVMLCAGSFGQELPPSMAPAGRIEKHGCAVMFLTNPFGDSPHGQLLAQMQGMIAEYERSQITDRTRRGRLHKAPQGRIYALGVPDLRLSLYT